MRIEIIRAGRISGNPARHLALAGQEVRLSYARDQARLNGLATQIAPTALVG